MSGGSACLAVAVEGHDHRRARRCRSRHAPRLSASDAQRRRRRPRTARPIRSTCPAPTPARRGRSPRPFGSKRRVAGRRSAATTPCGSCAHDSRAWPLALGTDRGRRLERQPLRRCACATSCAPAVASATITFTSGSPSRVVPMRSPVRQRVPADPAPAARDSAIDELGLAPPTRRLARVAVLAADAQLLRACARASAPGPITSLAVWQSMHSMPRWWWTSAATFSA